MMNISFYLCALMPVLICMALPSGLLAADAIALSAAHSCTKEQLSVSLDDRDGFYNGMSQSGTEMLLKNTASVVCSVSALPVLIFSDNLHRVLSVQQKYSRVMSPGSVLLPVNIEAGEKVRIPLRWVSGEVFEHTHCFRLEFISLKLPDGDLRLSFNRMMCAPEHESGYYVQSPVARE